MTTKRYALEPGGAPRLELTWRYGFKDLIVKVDGLEVGRVADPAELKLGRNFALADGSTLRVQLNAKFHCTSWWSLSDPRDTGHQTITGETGRASRSGLTPRARLLHAGMKAKICRL